MDKALKKRYEVLFFDLDHTLWDFETNSVDTLHDLYLEMGLKEKGIDDFNDFNLVYHEINDKLWDRFRKGQLSRQDLRWKRMFQTLIHYRMYNEELAVQMSERYLEILPTKNNVFPHAIELLAFCSEREYPMHLITNGFEETQKMKLRNAGMDIYFQHLITSEQAMTMKPHKEIFEYAFRVTGAEAATSLMIGDALDVDILGAQQVGMDAVYFNPKKINHQENPTFEIHSLEELIKILN
jgi:putative hydrolase of the HAD superfamily